MSSHYPCFLFRWNSNSHVGSLGSYEIVIGSNVASDFFIQVGEPEMVKTLKETDLPEPWFGNKSRAPLAPKRPRPPSNVMPETQALEAEVAAQGKNKGKGRGKGKNKENAVVKGKNIAKYDRTGPADVVLGRTKNPVADPEELRRKRVEDAAACGRVVKTIKPPGKRRSYTTVPDTESSDPNSDDVLAPTEKQMGSVTTSAVEAIALSGGKMGKSTCSTL